MDDLVQSYKMARFPCVIDYKSMAILKYFTSPLCDFEPIPYQMFHKQWRFLFLNSTFQQLV